MKMHNTPQPHAGREPRAEPMTEARLFRLENDYAAYRDSVSGGYVKPTAALDRAHCKAYQDAIEAAKKMLGAAP